MDVPFFSVIIPVHNSEKYLTKCLQSVINQTCKNYECLIIDDFSTDMSALIYQKVCKNNENFKYICLLENKGVSEARNEGIRNSNGKCILFLDSDDWWENNILEEIIKVYDDNTLIQFGFMGYKNQKQITFLPTNTQNMVLSGSMATVWSFAFPKNIIQGITFNTNLCAGEDYLFVNQAFANSKKSIIIKKALYNYYFDHPNSLMNKKDLRNIIDQIESTKQVERIYEETKRKIQKKQIKKRKTWCKWMFLKWYFCLFKTKRNKYIQKVENFIAYGLAKIF